MAIRTIGQVAAGAVLGAALVAVPTWAAVPSQDDGSTQRTDMASMMSDRQAQQQMTRAMSEMMSDPDLRKQMVSMMSDAMGEMPGMRGGMSRGMPDMIGMPGMGQRSGPGGSSQ